MAKYKDTLLTAAGKALATRAANGQAKFTITRAVGSKADLSAKTDDELMALTDLADVVQTAVMEEQVADPEGRDGVTGTQLIFANRDDDSQLNESYSLNAVGLYAKEDGTDTEILYAITTAEVAEYMPDFNSGVAYQFVLTVYVIVGQKANVTVNINLTGSATKQYVDDAIAEIPKPDMSEYYKKTEIDPMLAGKVTDNKDGSIQVNGAKVMPVDKAANDVALATKVVDNKNGEIQVNGVSILPLNGIQDASSPYGLDLDEYKDTGNYRFDDVNTIHYPATFAPQYIQLIIFGNHGIDSNGNPGSVTQIAIQDNSVAVRNLYTPSNYNTWRIISDAKAVADAKAAAITQALNDAKAEIAKLPKHVTLTQAQFDALATKDANTYYYIHA